MHNIGSEHRLQGWAIDYSAKDSWWGYLMALNNEIMLLKKLVNAHLEVAENSAILK